MRDERSSVSRRVKALPIAVVIADRQQSYRAPASRTGSSGAGLHPVITESKLRERSLSRIRIRRAVRLANLAESGALTRIGADARVFTAKYTVSERWSRALRNHPESPDGMLYRPRHDPARLAAALFERIADEVTAETAGIWLDQKTTLADVLDTYGVALIP